MEPNTQPKSRTPRRPPREPMPRFAKQHQESPGLESRLSPKPRYKAESYKAAGKLAGKIALVTGGDSGIGRAVALLYAREGASIAINYLPEEQVDADVTVAEIERAGGRCIQVPGDLSDAAFCSQLVEETVATLGRIDILVSNAAHQARKELEELTDEELEYTFSTNVFAYMRLARAALEHMQRHVWTPLNPSDPGLPPAGVAKFGADNPMGRPAQPEELAPAYVFLASNADSSYVTGTVLQVMGGETSGGVSDLIHL